MSNASVISTINIGPVRPVFKGTWDSKTVYEYLNIVRYDSQMWIMLGHNYVVGDVPRAESESYGTGSDTTSKSGRWVLMSGKGEKGDAGKDGEDADASLIDLSAYVGATGATGPIPQKKWEYETDSSGNLVLDSDGQPIPTGRIAFQIGTDEAGDPIYEDWVNLKGDTGPKGDDAKEKILTVQGVRGYAGDTPTLAIGNVSAADDVSNAGAAFRLVDGVYYLDLVLPRGVQGTGAVGNATTAESLSSAYTISITGGTNTVSSPVVFNGSKDIAINLSSIDASLVKGSSLSINTSGNANTATTASNVVGNVTLNNAPLKYTANNTTWNVLTPSDANAYGATLRVGGGEMTIVAAGEIGDSIYNSLSSKTDENLYLAADGNVYFYSNGQNGTGSAKVMTYDSSGNLTVPGTVYANAFSGAVAGAATTAGTCTGNSATATKLATARRITDRYLHNVSYIGSGKTSKTRTMCQYGYAYFDGTGDVTISISDTCWSDSCPSDSCSYCAYCWDCNDCGDSD